MYELPDSHNLTKLYHVGFDPGSPNGDVSGFDVWTKDFNGQLPDNWTPGTELTYKHVKNAIDSLNPRRQGYGQTNVPAPEPPYEPDPMYNLYSRAES